MDNYNISAIVKGCQLNKIIKYLQVQGPHIKIQINQPYSYLGFGEGFRNYLRSVCENEKFQIDKVNTALYNEYVLHFINIYKNVDAQVNQLTASFIFQHSKIIKEAFIPINFEDLLITLRQLQGGGDVTLVSGTSEYDLDLFNVKQNNIIENMTKTIWMKKPRNALAHSYHKYGIPHYHYWSTEEEIIALYLFGLRRTWLDMISNFYEARILRTQSRINYCFKQLQRSKFTKKTEKILKTLLYATTQDCPTNETTLRSLSDEELLGMVLRHIEPPENISLRRVYMSKAQLEMAPDRKYKDLKVIDKDTFRFNNLATVDTIFADEMPIGHNVEISEDNIIVEEVSLRQELEKDLPIYVQLYINQVIIDVMNLAEVSEYQNQSSAYYREVTVKQLKDMYLTQGKKLNINSQLYRGYVYNCISSFGSSIGIELEDIEGGVVQNITAPEVILSSRNDDINIINYHLTFVIYEILLHFFSMKVRLLKKLVLGAETSEIDFQVIGKALSEYLIIDYSKAQSNSFVRVVNAQDLLELGHLIPADSKHIKIWVIKLEDTLKAFKMWGDSNLNLLSKRKFRGRIVLGKGLSMDQPSLFLIDEGTDVIMNGAELYRLIYVAYYQDRYRGSYTLRKIIKDPSSEDFHIPTGVRVEIGSKNIELIKNIGVGLSICRGVNIYNLGKDEYRISGFTDVNRLSITKRRKSYCAATSLPSVEVLTIGNRKKAMPGVMSAEEYITYGHKLIIKNTIFNNESFTDVGSGGYYNIWMTQDEIISLDRLSIINGVIPGVREVVKEFWWGEPVDGTNILMFNSIFFGGAKQPRSVITPENIKRSFPEINVNGGKIVFNLPVYDDSWYSNNKTLASSYITNIGTQDEQNKVITLGKYDPVPMYTWDDVKNWIIPAFVEAFPDKIVEYSLLYASSPTLYQSAIHVGRQHSSTNLLNAWYMQFFLPTIVIAVPE